MYGIEEVVARVRGLTRERVVAWVERTWVCPASGEQGLVFDDIDIARMALICQLRDELQVDREAIPVVLSLIDQLHGLRRELRALVRAIEAQPGPVREDIIARVRQARGGGE